MRGDSMFKNLIYNKVSKAVAAGVAGSAIAFIRSTGLDVPPEVVDWIGSALLIAVVYFVPNKS
jgi:hypothetical protein